jgi:hypothetical protein
MHARTPRHATPMHAANKVNMAACIGNMARLLIILSGTAFVSSGTTFRPVHSVLQSRNLVVSHRPCKRSFTVPTSLMDPRKTPRDCSENVKPPRGAYRRSSKDCLPVAIPDFTLEANAAALLVSEQDFDRAITHTITSSRVLTAWVAFQMAHIDAEDSRTTSKWRVIDGIIASRFQSWDAQYRSNSELYLSPMDLKCTEVPEWNALAVFVLCRRIQDNTRNTNELSSSLTYHTYYRTFMSRMYLSAHTLAFLRYYTKPKSAFSTYRPKDISLVPTWLKTQGACVGLACEKFAGGKYTEWMNTGWMNIP